MRPCFISLKSNLGMRFFICLLKFEAKWPLSSVQKDTDTEPLKKGLSAQTERCFGKPLDKKTARSNWGQRPLNHRQMHYAAIDAFVQIKIYDHLHLRCRELGIQFIYKNPQNPSQKLIFG